MKTPSLSVMISNFNHGRFIPDALEAILAQSYRPVEIVVIDDASTDDSVAVLQQYERREPDLVRVIRNPRNMGVVHNTNHLVTLAAGDYAFMAAMDDRILPGFFERCMALLSRYPNAGLCSTLSRIMDESGNDQGLVKMPIVLSHEGFIAPGDASSLLSRHGNWLLGNATIYRRAALIEAGGFKDDLGPYCDGFASLAIALKHGACFIPEPLAAWRRMDGTYSNRATSNADVVLARLAHAEQLMRNDYHDLFPAEYVDEWKREMYFRVASSFAASAAEDGIAQAERILPGTTRFENLFYSAFRLWPRLGRKLAKPYFFVRLRRDRIWRMVVRRLTHLRLSMKPTPS